jgi:hypothetical protein
MSLEVSIFEAKALSNVSGRIKCRVELKQGSRRSMPETSVGVEEDNNPIFHGADFTLDCRDFDQEMADLTITVISGGDPIGFAEVPLRKILNGDDDYVKKL